LARELGFGALADPDAWLARLEAPGTVLEPAEFLDAGSLLETSGWLKQQFREDADKFPLLAARCASLGDFPGFAGRRSGDVFWPNGEISDDASSTLRRIRASIQQTRDSIQKTLRQILRSRPSGERRGLRYAAQRPVRDSCALGASAECSGCGAWSERNRADSVRGSRLKTVETNNQLVQLAEDEAAEIFRILKE